MYHATPFTASLVYTAGVVGAVVGCLLGGVLIDKLTPRQFFDATLVSAAVALLAQAMYFWQN